MRTEPKPHTGDEATEAVLSALKVPAVAEARVIDDERERPLSQIQGMERRRLTVLVHLTENTIENRNAVRAALQGLESIDIRSTGMSPTPQGDPGWGDDMGVWTYQLIYHAPAPAPD